jgi:hypothetical protein
MEYRIANHPNLEMLGKEVDDTKTKRKLKRIQNHHSKLPHSI